LGRLFIRLWARMVHEHVDTHSFNERQMTVIVLAIRHNAERRHMKSSMLHGTFSIAPSTMITQHTCISNRLIVIVVAVISGGYKRPTARARLPHNLTNCRGRFAALGLKSNSWHRVGLSFVVGTSPTTPLALPRPTTTEIPSKWPVVPRDVTATARTRYE
jgi:hypothetical protein